MTHNELNERLKSRIDWWHYHPGPFEGPACEGLEVGDLLYVEGFYAGWTKREVKNTPHLFISTKEADADVSHYLRQYWLAKWNGGPNQALEWRIKKVEQHQAAGAQANALREAAQVKYDKDYVKRWGPPSGYRTKTFDNFKAETQEQKASQEAASAFPYDAIDDYETRHYSNLVLAGPAGVGKTHLAAAMFTDQWERTGSTEFITGTALIRKFREKVAKESTLLERYGDGNDDSADPMDGGCEVLIVDDIGAGADADRYASEIFCEILDRRIGADLRSIFTTNCTRIEMLAWLGERGYSRLLNRCKWIALDGDDRRLCDPRPQKTLDGST